MKRVLLLCVLAGCGGHGSPAVHDKSVLVATSDDDVVATVDGRPIHASDVVAQMQASGKDRKAALDDLIDAEVLAGAAVDRGLYGDLDVTHARRAAEGRRLLRTDFEPRTAEDKIPDDALHRAYDANHDVYDHGELVEVQHILARLPEDAPAAQLQQAHDEIAALEPKAKLAKTTEEFAALADANAPVPTHVEQLGFPRHGVVVEPFAAAAFALTKPGQVSPPVRTSFGWHILRLVQRSPPRHVPFGDAAQELRDGVFGPWRTHQLELYLQALLDRYGVIEHKDKVPEPE